MCHCVLGKDGKIQSLSWCPSKMYSLHSPFVTCLLEFGFASKTWTIFRGVQGCFVDSQHHSTSFYIILQDRVVMNVTFPDAAGVVGISRPRIKNPRRNEEKDSVDAVETTAKRVAKQSEECLSCIALHWRSWSHTCLFPCWSLLGVHTGSASCVLPEHTDIPDTHGKISVHYLYPSLCRNHQKSILLHDQELLAGTLLYTPHGFRCC